MIKEVDIDFHFVDAPFPSTSAPGIELFYRPPYYEFWGDDNIESIRTARDWLANLLARSGPYDGLMMFSQGCALGISFLLHHQMKSPDVELPFKFAIFACGGPPLRDLEALGCSIAPSVWDRDLRSRRELAEAASTTSLLTHGSQRWRELEAVPTVDEFTGDIVTPYQIKIPTVHIIGRKDPRYISGLQLATLCDPKTREIYDHGGGHDIPRTNNVCKEISKLVETVALSVDW